MENNIDPTFHIGITMAGAVSAGAYTAGFMDYFLEALHLWEEKKSKNREFGIEHPQYDHRVPMHNVLIDVMGGASAGGMVCSMTALSSYLKHKPVKEPTYQKTGNVLFDSWVLMEDEIDAKGNLLKEGKSTFEKMLNTDDLNPTEGEVKSLLNTNPIFQLADNVFNQFKKTKNKEDQPNFISKDLRVLLTLCSLEGISFDLVFNRVQSAYFKNIPSHRMMEHMLIAHFKCDYDKEKDKNDFLNFDPYDSKARSLIQKCTLGTGAFPIGLQPQIFKDEIHSDYIKKSIKRSLSTSIDPNVTINLKNSNYNFINVDGGTINNEPYGEVVEVLASVNGPFDKEKPMYGTIMIDPFPDFYDLPKESNLKIGIFNVIPKLYHTLREQVRVKRGNYFFEDNFRFMVFPVKWEKKGKLVDHHPLACGGLGGFGGFFDIEFRMHDYFLGRNNARNFLRYFFSLELKEENPHPLFVGLHKKAVKVFAQKPKEAVQEAGKTLMPIIPDMNLLLEKKHNPYEYTYSNFPKLNKEKFTSLQSLIKIRLKKVIALTIKSEFKDKFWNRNLLLLLNYLFLNKINKKLVDTIYKNFEERKMV